MRKQILFLTVKFRASSGDIGPVRAEDPAPRAPAVAPDNTGRNVRDRDDKTLTPFDQSETEATGR